ncbi:enolase C-terminal domain-like protein [Nonomuraea sp. NPDC046802]|uniref:enolase C-terminal domain-like protein n=1 Tax=Nonomuraea sp. NPDC046802 TaxID=3154919 RepID=UPI0033F560E4
MGVTYHNPCCPISTAMCAHLTTVHPDVTLVEFIYGENVNRAAVISPPQTVTAGRLPLPTSPGLGVALAPGLAFVRETA